uniref:Major facilitator superfamily (MFS) profile domain-containing protein n=1 Tax=Romanomermis culicivorax TaxID=13658 RepID=A0A915LAA0_ROMCU
MKLLDKFLRGSYDERNPNKKATFLIVYVALFLDNMLMTTIEKSTGHLESDYGQDSLYIGLLLGSNGFVQLVSNPIVGSLTNRIGYTVPMFFGFIILFISTMTFALAESYTALFAARSVQGLASVCSSTSGMGMLAQVFTDDGERGRAISAALGGLAMGLLVGFQFGGFLYDFAGKPAPFLILAAIALLEAILQLRFLPPKIRRQDVKGTPLAKLLSDPYILMAAIGIFLASLCVSLLEPTLPLWMKEMMGASSTTIAMLFIPVTGSYLFGVHVFGLFAHKIGRFLLAFIGLLVCGISLIAISFPRTVYQLIAPNFTLGLSLGMFDAVIFPEMGNLVDRRHKGVYGSIYAIADAAVCCAFAFG